MPNRKVAPNIPGHTLRTLNLIVDYDLSDEEAVRAGNYESWAAPPYDQDPPCVRHGKQKVEVVLIRFEAELQRFDVGQAFKRMGLERAGIRELLALGEQFPNLQRKSTIVALSPDKKPKTDPWTSPFLGTREIRGKMRRVFTIPLFEIWWDHPVRFLATRKTT